MVVDAAVAEGTEGDEAWQRAVAALDRAVGERQSAVDVARVMSEQLGPPLANALPRAHDDVNELADGVVA